MAFFSGSALAAFLITAVIFIHFQALRLLSAWHEATRLPGHTRILLIIFALFAAHVMEAVVFAGGYWAGEDWLRIGLFAGARPVDMMSLLYFSLEAFTTQGIGDIYPIGVLRLVASLEPLAGLVLIGWSASFTFLLMAREWQVSAPLQRKNAEPTATTPSPKFARAK